MRKYILTSLIAICCFTTQVMAQEFSYNNSKDNEPATNPNIYEYLKASGYNPIEQVFKDHNAVIFYDKPSGGLIQIEVHYESGYISIVQFASEKNQTTGKTQVIDFRPLGDKTMYFIANATMVTTEMVKVLYNNEKGSVSFVVELPLMRMYDFKLYFDKCLHNILSARNFIDKILKLASENSNNK